MLTLDQEDERVYFLLSGQAQVYKERTAFKVEDDKAIYEELSYITRPDNMGPTATLDDLFRLSPALRYNIKGDYSHIEGVRFFPRAVLYRPSFLEAHRLPPDSLTKLANTGIFDGGGVMIRQLEEIVPAGSTFGDEVLFGHKKYLTAALTSSTGILAAFSKQSFEEGLEVAIQVEAERRLSYMMTRVFHDALPLAISKKVTVAMIRNEVVIDKNHCVPTKNARMFCVFDGSIAVRKPVRDAKELSSPSGVQRTNTADGKVARQAISRREKTRDVSSRLPSVNKKYFDMPIELRVDKRFKNLMLRKKQNPTGYETVMNLQSGEIFGLFEMMHGLQFNYEIQAIEKSTIISISSDTVAEFMNESQYFKKFVRNHLREVRNFNVLAAQQKSRIHKFHEKLEERRELLEKEMAYNDPNNPETRESVDVARKCINDLVGHRKPENVNIFQNHNKHYWDKLDQDHADMVEDFNKLFQKPDKRLRFKLMRENAIPIKDKPPNNSVITLKSSTPSRSNLDKLNLGPSINISVIDEVEVSFVQSSENHSQYSHRQSSLASKLYQLSKSPGGSKNLAEYIASKITRTSSYSGDRRNHARSYDQSSKSRKKQIFETVVEKSMSIDQEPSIIIKPVSANKITRYLKQPLVRESQSKYEYRPYKARSQTTKPRIKFEVLLN